MIHGQQKKYKEINLMNLKRLKFSLIFLKLLMNTLKPVKISIMDHKTQNNFVEM